MLKIKFIVLSIKSHFWNKLQLSDFDYECIIMTAYMEFLSLIITNFKLWYGYLLVITQKLLDGKSWTLEYETSSNRFLLKVL